MTPFEMLLDENCDENIILYGEDGEETEFEQVAVIPHEDRMFVILRPIDMEGVEEDEAFVFELVEEDGEASINLCEDDDMIETIFGIYYSLLEDEEV